MKCAALILAALASFPAWAQRAMPPAPWEFGMSPSQVSAVAEGLPYKKFSNGDLETFSATFDGSPQNFQFFFRADKLRRIGIYLYEGENATDAGAQWLRVHAWLTGHFSRIRSVGNIASTSGDAGAFVKEAIRIAERDGKTQLLPDVQPAGAHIFASFMGNALGASRQYLVILYFDNPAEPP